jgi:hypothetical protein
MVEVDGETRRQGDEEKNLGVASLRDGLELMKKFLFQRSRIFKEYELSKM